MSLWILENFDDGQHGPRRADSTVGVIDTTNEIPGHIRCLRVGDSHGDYWSYDNGVGGDNAEVIVGFNDRIRVNGTGPNPSTVLMFRAQGTVASNPEVIGTIVVNMDDWSVAAYRGNQATQLGADSAVDVVAYDVWHYMEVRWLVSDTVGEVEVRINGVTVLDLTTQDTKGTADKIGHVSIMGTASATDLDSALIDDVYVLDTSGSAPDNTFLGPVFIQQLFPDDDGSNIDLVGSDGNSVDNFAQVDDRDGGTDYNESDLEGDHDLYLFPNIPTNLDILAIQVTNEAGKIDDGQAKYGRNIIRTNSTNYNGDSVALGPVSLGQDTIWALNPNTGLVWTPTEINSLETGFEVRDS